MDIVELGVVAGEIFSNQVIFGFQRHELGYREFSGGESRPTRQLSTMLAFETLEFVGILDSLLDFKFDCDLVLVEILFKEETLGLGEDALSAVGRRPSHSLHPNLAELDHVETDEIIEHVGVWNRREQSHSRRVVWVALREKQLDMEDTTFIRSAFGASNVAVPLEEVMLQRPGCDSHSGDFLVLDFLKILGQSLVGEGLHLLVD